jgi:site-specific DNA recombinase
MEQGPEGWLFFQMRGALAEYERAKIVERTQRGRLGRAKAGHASGGAVPYGYRYIGSPHQGRWEIDEAEAAVVRRIFAMYLDGAPIRRIAVQLTQEHVLTARDKPQHRGGPKRTGQGSWAASTVHAILQNAAYMGRAHFNKRQYQRLKDGRWLTRERPRDEWIEIQVPAIIDEATFEAAHQQIERNRQLSTRRMTRTYLLRGRWFTCRRCGSAMVGFASHGKTRYYRCTSQTDKLLPAERCSGTIRADVAEEQVWNAVIGLLENPELIRQEVARQSAELTTHEHAIDAERDTLRRALSRCEQMEQRWLEAYSEGAISLAELKAYRADLQERALLLTRQLDECATKAQGLQEQLQQVGALMDYCQRVRQALQTFSLEEKQCAFDALAIRATFLRGSPLRIEARIPVVSESNALKDHVP